MEFLALLVVVLLLAPFALGAWANVRAARLEKAGAQWQRGFEDLKLVAEVQAEQIAALRRDIALLRGEPIPDDAPFAAAPDAAAAAADAAFADEQSPEPAGAVPPTDAQTRRLRWRPWEGGLERQFGAVLPVWIGGIALAFSGFFLVKYSIENELVGPQMRVLLGGLLGIALVLAGRWVRERAGAFGGHRIAQALAGAGIAVLYLAAYAGTALYGILPPIIGFTAMAATTALAVVLALRHGPPIALLGLLGGFLTPALMGSEEPSAFLFFTYLYFVFAALMAVIRKRGWWLLTFPAMILAFGWALAWIFTPYAQQGETLWMGLFLVAIAGTIIGATRERYQEETAAIQSWRDLLSWRNRALALNVTGLAGAMALMAMLAFNVQLGLHDWVLFATLAVGAVALAFFDTRLYGFAPWAAMAVNAVMLAGWNPQSAQEFTVALIAFGSLYITSGFLLVSSASAPALWAGLSGFTAVGYFLLGYFRLTPAAPIEPAPIAIDLPPSREPVEPLVEAVKETAAAVSYVWGSLAMGLALLFFGGAMWAAKNLQPSLSKERVLAIYALATSAFVALAFFIELDREFLSVAIAAELLAVAWVASRTQLAMLRPIAGLLGVTFAFLLLPQILLLIQLAFHSTLDVEWYVQESIPIVAYPTFQLLLPAALILLAAYTLRRQADGLIVRLFEFAAIGLIALWGYYSTSHLFHTEETVLFARAGFLERGLITNVLFLYGLGCLWTGRQFGRSAFFASGAALCIVALFRILYFDLFLRNPLWTQDAVPGVTPFDALTLTLVLPMAWSWLAAAELNRSELAGPRLRRLAGLMRGLPLLFGFAWISLTIRKLYQGEYLAGVTMSDAEFYSYSAAWLLFGLALLFFGTLKHSQLLRYASLAIMLATVSKVFLLDAGNLTGLYRVFSFLGLGLSLLGISYVYSRFVFGGGDEGGGEQPTAASGAP